MKAALKARVLSEWRGCEAGKPVRQEVTVGDTARDVLKKLGVREALDESSIQAAWRELVGDFLASQASPGRFKDGLLLIRVTHSSVLYEMDRVWKPRILEKLKARFPQAKIRALKFVCG